MQTVLESLMESQVSVCNQEYTTVPIKDNVALARVLLVSIVCKSSEQRAIACVNSSISIFYT